MDAAAFAAALDFERGCYARAVASATPHALGLLLRDPAVPAAHVANMLWVTTRQLTAPELLAALEETQAGLGHRKAQVDDDALGAALAEPMRAAGYAVEHDVVMVLRRPRDREATAAAREVGEAEHSALEEAIEHEYPHGRDAEVVRQLTIARAAIRGAAEDGTRFFVGVDDGVPAAHATLLRGGDIAQLEDVGTLEAHRGRGLARAACSLGLDAAAGAALVFLVADADDWPRQLYGKLGFDPVGAFWAFTRSPA